MLNARLQAILKRLVGSDGARDLEVLQCSSASATGAIIFHVSDQNGRGKHVVVKTAREPTADHSIAAEWETVNELCRDEKIGSLMPPPLGRFELEGATFFAYGRICGDTMFAHYRNRILSARDSVRSAFGRQALDAALSLHASHTRAVSGVAMAEDLRSNLRGLRNLVKDIPVELESSANSAADALATSGLELPAGRIHGDFSPYNLMTESLHGSRCTGIIDWEHSEFDRPQYLDIFRFISGCELMGRRRFEGAAALRRMSEVGNPVAASLWRPWLRRMAEQHAEAAVRPLVNEALWMHFFVVAAHREQRRQANPEVVGQTTYFRSLCELTATTASPSLVR